MERKVKKPSQISGKLVSSGRQVTIHISDGVISNIVPNSVSRHSSKGTPFIAPGFIDNQINGYLGIDFTEPCLTAQKVKKVTKALWEKGVTTYLPTLITHSQARFIGNLAILTKAQEDPQTGKSIPGFHLEGPYISPEEGFRGTHDLQWVREPSKNEFNRFIEASENNILQVTLAPEREGALDFIKWIRDKNIIVALGHHNGSAKRIHKAVTAGASIATHLGNGCANQIHRHKNPLWPQLADDRLAASVIVDRRHLTKDEVRVFYKVKGKNNLILTSDITKFAGMQPGEYSWGNKKICLTEDGYIKNIKQVSWPDQR
jgi:N-acetylglucosamine-6-phosphate deacetylase